MAAYGALHKKSRRTVTYIMDKVRAKYPDVCCTVAYTSQAMMGKMREQGLETVPVEQELNRLLDLGYAKLVIQSLHMIPGEEYHQVLRLAHGLRKNHPARPLIRIGHPLLGSEDALKMVAGRILSVIPDISGKDEAVVLMGHGTKHPGNDFYVQLNKYLGHLAGHVFLGTLEADPGIGHIQDKLLKKGVKKVYLMPFLFGAGVHAARDLGGDKEGSWKMVLAGMDIECETILKGVGEYEEFVNIWLNNLDKAMAG